MRSSWSVSRVLSLKAIINLDAILLLYSSGHGNGRAAHCSTPCTSRSLQRIIVTNISSELLPHFFTIAYTGCIFLLHFSSSHLGLTLSSVIALWCSDFPHAKLRVIAQSTIIIITHIFIFVKYALFCKFLFINIIIMQIN